MLLVEKQFFHLEYVYHSDFCGRDVFTKCKFCLLVITFDLSTLLAVFQRFRLFIDFTLCHSSNFAILRCFLLFKLIKYTDSCLGLSRDRNVSRTRLFTILINNYTGCFQKCHSTCDLSFGVTFFFNYKIAPKFTISPKNDYYEIQKKVTKRSIIHDPHKITMPARPIWPII